MNDAGPSASTPQVRTLLLTDLCDSTQLVERLGDAAAADLFRAHDRLVLDLQQRWRGRLIDRSDGLLLLFERPIDGLGFALDYARGLRELAQRPEVQARKLEPRARAGLHVGEVLTWRNSEAAIQAGAKSLEVEGLAKPLAARLMTLARPGQILLSATAEPLARRAARELGDRADTLVWKSHGRWRFKGMPDGQEIYEVGEPGHAPLAPPRQSGGKAWRDIPLWRRPAALAAQVLLAIGMGVGLWFITQPTPAIAFNERDWVVVGDLRNFTGDTVLDESLDQAFRISLEQSRYVNVLSDLKVRDTLQLMNLAGDTRLDRNLASEVAIRDGARAVILPTVSEVGGRVRVSAEVIDPQTQTTVYAETADGKGVESALGSVDRVVSGLRGKLGEAITSIEKTSVPLPNVSTPSLDALKAYALGEQRRAAGLKKEAIAFHQRALSIDGDFAMAMLRIARLEDSLNDLSLGQEYFQRAARRRDRLPPREALLLDAELATRESIDKGLQHWRELAALYPDLDIAQYRLAQEGLFYANRYRDSLEAAQAAASPQSPYQAMASYLKGIILLGLERYAESDKAFRASRQLGFKGEGIFHAYAFAAQRDYIGADAILALRTPTGVPSAELDVLMYRMLVAIDRGNPADALRYAVHGLEQAKETGQPIAIAEWRNRVLTSKFLLAEGPSPVMRAELRAEISDLSRDASALDAVFPHISEYLLLGAGYLGARMDDASAVAQALAALGANPPASVPLSQMRTVLQAEAMRLKGEYAAGMKLLAPLVEQEETIVPVHASLMRLARADGRIDIAKSQEAWLSRHRGRAYVEQGADFLPTPLNLVDTNISQHRSRKQ